MKFTLNEKYKLDEAKFILDERFTLTEAEADIAGLNRTLETIKGLLKTSYTTGLNNCNTTIDNIIESLQKILDNNTTFKNAKSALTKVLTTGNRWTAGSGFQNLNFNEIKKTINDFIQKYTTEVEAKLKPELKNTATFKKIAKQIDLINTELPKINYSDKDADKIKAAALKKINTLFNTLYANISTALGGIDEDTGADLAQAVELIKPLQETSKNLYTNIQELIKKDEDKTILDCDGNDGIINKLVSRLNAADTTTYNQYNTILTTLNTALNDSKADFTKIPTPATDGKIKADVLNTFLRQINSIIGHFEAANKAVIATKDKFIEFAELETEDAEFKSKFDWPTLFKEVTAGQPVKLGDTTIKGVDELWRAYFIAEWKGFSVENDLPQLRSLGDTLIRELNYFGYTKNENPFIEFLQTPLDDGTVLSNINRISYGGIHNAYVDRNVTNDMLRGGKDPIIKETNILFNKNLYTLPSSGQVEVYLNQQAEILKSINTEWAKISLTVIKDRYASIPQNLSRDIFTTNPLTNNYVPGSNKNKLNTKETVRDFYTKIFNKQLNDAVTEDFTLSADLKSKLIGHPELGNKLINLIIATYTGSKSEADIAGITNSLTAFKPDLQFKPLEARAYKKELDKFNMDKDCLNAIKAIADASGLTTKEEA